MGLGSACNQGFLFNFLVPVVCTSHIGRHSPDGHHEKSWPGYILSYIFVTVVGEEFSLYSWCIASGAVKVRFPFGMESLCSSPPRIVSEGPFRRLYKNCTSFARAQR